MEQKENNQQETQEKNLQEQELNEEDLKDVNGGLVVRREKKSRMI